MSTIDELYACYELLNSATDKSEAKESYLTVVNGTKSGANEKRLASQLIARFFKHFPDVQELALNALLDLCEDTDITIRKQAIRDLPTICRECPSYTQRIADILTQLLQVEDAVELRLVEHSLMELTRRDAREAFAGILNQLDIATDEAFRALVARFIGTRVKELSDSGVLSAGGDECATFLANRIKESMEKRKATLGGNEFVALMTALSALHTMQNVAGRAHLVSLACEQVVSTVPVGSECESEQLDKLLTCCKLMVPLLSKSVSANPIIDYVCSRVLPRFSSVATANNSSQSQKPQDLRLEVLKEFAEVCAFAGPLEPHRADLLVSHLLATLLAYLPAASCDAADPSNAEDLQLSHLECLLFAFHRLAGFVEYSKALSGLDAAASSLEAVRELHKRLQWLGRRVQQLRSKLAEAVRFRTAAPRGVLANTGAESDADAEAKLKDAALRTVNNIFALIRDLLHLPPLQKATVTLSWKPICANRTPTVQRSLQQTPVSATNSASSTKNSAAKRPAAPLSNTNANATPVAPKQPRTAKPPPRGIYQPPSARYQPGATRGSARNAAPRYSMGGRGRATFRRGAFRGGRF